MFAVVTEAELNRPELRRAKRLCLYICPDCGYKNFFTYKISQSKLPVQCKNPSCHCILDHDNDCEFDSYHPEIYPGYGAMIEGKWPDGNEKITLYCETKCPDCQKQVWLPYRKSHVCYEECECHRQQKKAKEERDVREQETRIAVMKASVPAETVVIDWTFTTTLKIKRLIMEDCFDNDKTKEQWMREAVEEKLRSDGYEV